MRILLLSQWFDPEPTFKGLLFAKTLAARGHEVEVLTGFPNYPGGKLYPGYAVRPWQRTVMDGIVVNRVALYPSHDKNHVKRAANYASFALSAATLGPLLVKAPDVIYTYHPPATIGLAAAALRARFGAPIIYDIQDMWPDTLASLGIIKHPLLTSAIDAGMKGIYALAEQIVVLSPGFKKLLVERGVPDAKVSVIYNWTFEAGAAAARDENLERELGLAGRFNVVFAGTMGMAQGLDTALEVAPLLAQRAPHAQLVFIGGGVERQRLEEHAKQRGLRNVRFLPRVDPSQMGPILAAADATLVHLIDKPLFRITIPSKIQSYMLARRPLLCGVRGDAAAVVQEADCGVVFEPQNPLAMLEATMRLIDLPAKEREAMGQRGHDFYQRRMSLEAGVVAFEKLFERIKLRTARPPVGDARSRNPLP